MMRRAVCYFTFALTLSIYPAQNYASDKAALPQACPPRGLTIPAEVPFKRIGMMPGWERSGTSGGLRDVGSAFYGQEIVTKGPTDCAVLYFANPDRSRVVKDSVEITKAYRNPGAPWTEQGNCYVLRPDGSFDHESNDLIIGFTLPEKGREGCTHYSRRVRGAWRINFDTGRYIPVPTKQLICDRPEAGDGCYDCKRPKPGFPCTYR